MWYTKSNAPLQTLNNNLQMSHKFNSCTHLTKYNMQNIPTKTIRFSNTYTDIKIIMTGHTLAGKY